MKKLFSGFKLFNCKRNKELQISVSVLSAINKEKAIFELNNTDVDYIHLDVMDGKFVDNSVFSFSQINKISRREGMKNFITSMKQFQKNR